MTKDYIVCYEVRNEGAIGIWTHQTFRVNAESEEAAQDEARQQAYARKLEVRSPVYCNVVMSPPDTVKPLPYPGRTTWEAQKNMESRGSYWWTPDTMRFFGTRLGSEFYGLGGLYFVTSEKHPNGRYPATIRLYSVRKYNPESNDIETIGEFGGYRTASPARTEARRLSKGI